MEYYEVYIVKCVDGLFHSGLTKDLKRSIIDLNSGKDPTSFTYGRRPVKLVWNAKFSNIDEAILFEQDLRKWSKSKKEALVSGVYKLTEVYS